MILHEVFKLRYGWMALLRMKCYLLCVRLCEGSSHESQKIGEITA